MTQPDEFLPESATNFDSFASYAAKTQEDYEAERGGAEVDRWGADGVLGGLRGGLPLGMSIPQAFFTWLADILNLEWIGETLEAVGEALASFFNNLWESLKQIGEILLGLIVTPINLVVQAVKDWFGWLGSGLAAIFGGQNPNDEDFDVDEVNVTTRVQKVTDMGQAMWDCWFPGAAGGGPEEPAAKAQQVMEAVNDAVIGGWFVETKTSSGTWTVDRTKNKLRLILFPGGEDGNDGGTFKGNTGGTASGGTGGRASGPLVVDLNIADIVEDEVSYIVSAGNSATSFGSYASIDPGALGGFSSSDFPLYVPHQSGSGFGGKGGNVVHGTSAGTGVDGGSSAVAAGGDGGVGAVGVAGVVAGNGGNGGNASLAAQTKCAGGAGGGGGGCSNTAAGFNNSTGGYGGDGGYPSGPGGGGGAAATSLTGGTPTGGAGGLGAVGVLFIMTQ